MGRAVSNRVSSNRSEVKEGGHAADSCTSSLIYAWMRCTRVSCAHVDGANVVYVADDGVWYGADEEEDNEDSDANDASDIDEDEAVSVGDAPSLP